MEGAGSGQGLRGGGGAGQRFTSTVGPGGGSAGPADHGRGGAGGFRAGRTTGPAGSGRAAGSRRLLAGAPGREPLHGSPASPECARPSRPASQRASVLACVCVWAQALHEADARLA